MKEKNFWLLLSALVVVLSLICVFLVGFGFFYIFPPPRIPASTQDINSTITAYVIATFTPVSEKPNTPPLIIVPSSTPTKIAASSSSTHIYTAAPSTYTPVAPQTQMSPDEFIRLYYSLINQGQYQTTFGMLSDDFKDRKHCCNPDGSYQFEPYVDWWDSISKVTVLSVDTKRSDEASAQVVVEIRYNYNSDREVVDTHTFNLIADLLGSSWLIE